MNATVRPLPTVAALTAEVERLHERMQEELHRPGAWRWWRVAALRRRLAGIAGSLGDALADARGWA
ncbi:hypothetical protein M0638_27595 [Roseomonas sp. NAR14]|uniref:Uncharacterized protein n=1 Tax=Roseomonas acroporae TaxID=2937791 RepID=A0A9X1YCY0_9PROT|nr:hypothetical protein [Roseomonas acroporae]MCK8788124.1 hypothetical protein [Roseomonas acroporae]